MLFSIIVPVYKAEKYLNKCVDSILGQTYRDFELVLIDDGSPDNSPEICDKYAQNDDRVVVIHKNNGGVVSARNAGLKIAGGEYVLFADADDWVAENMLQELVAVINDYNAPDMILFDAYKVYSDEKSKMHQAPDKGYYDKEKMINEIIPTMIYDRKQTFLTAAIAGQLWNKAYKRSIIKEHHCTDESLYKSEDFACVYECIYFSESFYYLDNVLYYYNKMNESSAMTTYDKTYFKNHSNVIKYTQEHLGVHSDIIRKQIDAYNVSGICIGVFHEVRHGRKLRDASSHIKRQLSETDCITQTSCAGLPMHAKLFMFLLKHKMYFIALFVAKTALKIRKN